MRPHVRSYSFRETEDGAILVAKVVDRGDRNPFCNYTTWRIHADADEAIACDHGNDRTLCRLERDLTLQVHRSPFRLEFWASEEAACVSSDGLLAVMEALLSRSLNSKASCRADADSPRGGGRKCVLSDAIRDTLLAPDEFWREARAHLTKGAREILPNGCVVLEDAAQGLWTLGVTPWPSLNPGKSCWVKHIFDGTSYELHSYRYGEDSTLSKKNLEMVTHLKVHWRPYRLEMWASAPPQRCAGEPEKAILVELLDPLIEKAKEQHRCRSLEEVERASVRDFREELCLYQDELRKELQALVSEVADISKQRAQEKLGPEASCAQSACDHVVPAQRASMIMGDE